MICKVIDTIRKHSLLSFGESIAVGVSGGADSMCLLHILSRLKEEYGIVLKVVHINHNLRGEESERDEELVRSYCRSNNIEFLLFNEDIASLAAGKGMSIEECGRQVRYSCFERAECDKVAVAHNLNDSIETTVYNLLRGTGTKGLCGIPAKREPNIIRPLIECTRREIEEYCKDNNISYITDSSNLSDDYTRNFIRHNIVPVFNRINKNYETSISRTQEIIFEEDDFINECAEKLLKDTFCFEGVYRTNEFIKAHSAVRKRALSIILSDKMKKTPEFRHIIKADQIICDKKGKLEISKDFYFLCNNELFGFDQKVIPEEKWESTFKDGAAVTPYGKYRLIKASLESEDSFDLNKTMGNLTLSSRREGDVFSFKKRKLTKSLKKLFNEMKIPLSQRGSLAVLRDENSVIWVEGIGTNKEYIPDEKSTEIISIIKEG